MDRRHRVCRRGVFGHRGRIKSIANVTEKHRTAEMGCDLCRGRADYPDR